MAKRTFYSFQAVKRIQYEVQGPREKVTGARGRPGERPRGEAGEAIGRCHEYSIFKIDFHSFFEVKLAKKQLADFFFLFLTIGRCNRCNE